MTNQVQQRQATVLPDLTPAPVTTVDVHAELARLKAENAMLIAKGAQATTVRCKITEKGGVSIYGMGRWPYTFYKSQWVVFYNHVKMINDFFVANDGKLATKPAKG